LPGQRAQKTSAKEGEKMSVCKNCNGTGLEPTLPMFGAGYCTMCGGLGRMKKKAAVEVELVKAPPSARPPVKAKHGKKRR